MDKVDVNEIEAYSWECPNCNHYNCHDKYADLVCDGCAKEFEVGKVN